MTAMLEQLTQLHNQLVAEAPEGASHDEALCAFCNGTAVAVQSDREEGAVKTYTEDEMASVLAQVADLEAKVEELASVKQESEIEARLSEVKAEMQAALDEVRSELDTAVLEAQAAKDERDAIVAYLEAVQAEAEAAALRESVLAERIERVREVASFPDDHIEKNAERWASMDEETFAACLTDWAAIAPKSSTASFETLPSETALTASREDSKNSAWGVLRLKDSDFRAIRF